MNAKQKAENAVNKLAPGDWQPVEGTVLVALSTDGKYSVMDNGEETSGLGKAAAIKLAAAFVKANS